MQNTLETYFVAPTGDKTDMKGAIEEKLREHGSCMLGCGEYYVSGIEMPEGSTVMGLGYASKLILLSDIESGYTVKMSSYCTVKDLAVLGSPERLPRPTELGNRHGIAFVGTATHENYSNQPRHSIINSCFISSFSGGGITCVDTGYHTSSSITASDCHIYSCGAAINIPHFSEYHEFTNMLCTDSLYGCINNGGNNVFVNCGFNSNTTGFVIDNRDGQSINNSHGSAVGCTFNHTDKNRGIGILLIGVNCGYVFTGCQVFYSKIVCDGCDRINFNAINYGRDQEIILKNSKLTLFQNSFFKISPTLTKDETSEVKFINCFTAEGEPISF